jgi:urea carboxylase
MKKLSQKHVAKEYAKKNNVTTIPASGLLSSVEDAVQWANNIGYPCVLKLTAAGGGIGIQLCEDESQVREKYNKTFLQGVKFYGTGEMYVEKFIPRPRHVEVQVLGDGKGNVIHLGERECSIQRRYQKIIEESPCPALTPELRDKVCQMAVRLCQSVAYKSAGTVEFLFVEAAEQFYFLEVNTRLQVEHRLTELCHGIDMVEWMIRLACPSDRNDINLIPFQPRGHAIECRIYAEDPLNGFKPSHGMVTEVILPKESSSCIVDTWIFHGCNVSSNFDPLLANIVHWGPTRSQAARQLVQSLKRTVIGGPYSNLGYVTDIISSRSFTIGDIHVNILKDHVCTPRCVEVVSPGLLTTVQDWPGRKGRGLWRIGVPPSGPMDHFACRVANGIVGNPETDAVLEFTLTGPTLKIRCDTSIALTGASMDATLDGQAISMWKKIIVKSGSVLKIGSRNTNLGSRAYLSIAGGIDVPKYLGSRSTFPNGHFGGYQGRPLTVGDVLPFGIPRHLSNTDVLTQLDAAKLTAEYSEKWEVGVLPGPHANPDFLTDKDITMFYTTEWDIGHNSNRLGIRLMGPAPEWSRTDGGEGGSHPSNIHDCEYAVGTIDFTGNMPIIIAQDGPSLGGFVCPCTIVQSELWKIGQVKAGDTIKFRKMTIKEAVQARLVQDEFIKSLTWPCQVSSPLFLPECYPPTSAILHKIPSSDVHPGANIRLAGDSYILIEYGAMVLDLNLRFRVHFLELWLLKHDIVGLEETAPGVRSLQIRYDPIILPLADLIEIVLVADKEVGSISQKSITSRVLYLPMCFNYSGVDEAITKYMKSVRPQAPYLPSNIQYVAQNNGLAGQQDVEEKVFAASYMCLGLGDVYLGACCAVPVNPLHRMVTTKYNPARTFTQEGTVGLGGSYMCIYPMNSPGGYQLVGRTLPIWDTFAVTNRNLFSRRKP